MWARLLRGFSDVFFPPVCVHCGGLVEDAPFRHLCARCAGKLEPAPAGALAAARFRGPVRSLVIELKYRRGLHLLEDAERVFRGAPRVIEAARGAVLVPVPLHPRKARERGFNQSLLLARCLARAAGAARVVPLLRRRIDTPSQTSLGRRRRRANLKNAFALAPRRDFDRGLRYLIVDDVSTTGSTLACCVRVLRDAGCLSVEAAAFAAG